MTESIQNTVKSVKAKRTKAPISNDPMSCLQKAITVKSLATVKKLLEEGKGQLKAADLVTAMGSVRLMRHAIWAARYSGLKMVPLREGRKIISYVNTLSESTPQTKHIPKDMKPLWKSWATAPITA
jgi:hypothetical protein